MSLTNTFINYVSSVHELLVYYMFQIKIKNVTMAITGETVIFDVKLGVLGMGETLYVVKEMEHV